MTNPILKRSIQRTLYSLKREYGASLGVYRLLSSSVDAETGIPTVTKEVYNLRRAIVLPESLSLLEIRGISLISANKEMVQGGQWESGLRTILIDQTDLPIELTTDDWCVFNGDKYEFESVQDYAQTAWIIRAKLASGDPPQEIHNLWAENFVKVTSGAI